ncbi:kinase-like protein [Paxillus ammoniavirescens]|nr:kinase-like protein [Paxillus ammoniavirescens]
MSTGGKSTGCWSVWKRTGGMNGAGGQAKWTTRNKPCYKDLTAVIKRREQYASQSGGFGDIWECDLVTEKPSRKVVVKTVRAQRIDTPNMAAQEKKLRHELNVWTTLQHENIVELLGVVSGFGLLPSMVSLWFSNRSLSSYLSNHKAMNLSERQGLLFDIASGLMYFHDWGVIHGDLHGVWLLLGCIRKIVDFPDRAIFLLMKMKGLASQTLTWFNKSCRWQGCVSHKAK